MNTETDTITVVEAITVPTTTITAIREVAEALQAADVPELAQRVHDEILPWVNEIEEMGLSDGVHDLVDDNSGWRELFSLISDAANSLNYCHTHPAVDGVPAFVTEDERERFEGIERFRAESYVRATAA